MNQSPLHLIKLLQKNGFIFKRYKSSHQIFYNTASNSTVIAPVHGSKERYIVCNFKTSQY
jgi:predicted RNA binding protein YcfA (HicA-like mRNA interferase family)